MGSANKDKAKGNMNVVKGSVKEGVGKLVGNPKMRAEGMVDKIVGHAQKAMGAAKDNAQSLAKDTGTQIKRAGEKIDRASRK